MVGDFRYTSERSRKARFAVKLKPFVRWWWALVLILVAAGVMLLAIESAWGWFVMSIAALPYAIHRWYQGELDDIPPQGSTVDGLLVSDILGRIPRNPTPRDIAWALRSVNDSAFMALRLGLRPVLLEEIVSDTPQDTVQVWQLADAIRQQNGLSEITSGVLMAALIRTVPGYETVLAHLHIDDADLDATIQWQEHIRQLAEKAKRPRRTGGIARDWSFGYIPLLTRFGQNISEQIGRGGGMFTVDIASHQQAIDQLVDTFSRHGRQNAVLVGQAGTGKTTIIHAFADRLLDASERLSRDLKFRQVFILDSSALISTAPGRGELENLVMQVLGEAYMAKNIIICLDNAQLFFEEGVGAVDLTNVLLPILEAGRLRVILSMDEQRFLQIGQRNPSLINALNRITVPPTDEGDTLHVLQEQAVIIEHQQRVVYQYQALREAYRLSVRYIHDLAMPGQAIKLLESAARYHHDGIVTQQSVQQAIEQTMDVKIGVANDTDERQRLLNMEELIHQRMVDQTRAVNVVSDALRRARAGVRNQNRPIGAFLFLGPTGVGKTELSKALADVYFGGEERMIRIDLNEYVRPEDVMRLIADGADDPMSLTAQVMKQPFSVVLLDEIEKAAPEVLATLLQLLDEGILRDTRNREVSFRDAIVIATSNAGADRIRQYIEQGYKLEQFEQQFTDELINSGQFRPEFLNRFDEIVLFRPFAIEELGQVFDLIVASVNKTLALQKITVAVAPDARDFLVQQGYDPRLGARPMRRVVQKAVENTVARQMLSGTVAPGSTITVTLEQAQAAFRSDESI